MKVASRRVLRSSGFTLMETMVSMAVLGIFFVALVSIMSQVLNNIGESRLRTTAVALAQSKMEVIRNLPYASVGTVGGIPSGPIAQTENIVINNLTFSVSTSIIYIDDAFDGVVPADLVNNDYKRARIEVRWGGAFPSRVPVTFVTNIAPKGVESTAGGGTLFIQVFNSLGAPVNAANVTVVNTTVNPAINLNQLTDSNGQLVIPGAPACVNCYQITANKAGYSTDRTYGTNEVANPLQPHPTVIAGQLTQLSFAIDAASTIIVNSVGPAPNYSTVTNVQFTLRGEKIIGYDTTDSPVYKYAFTTNTGGGSVNIPGLEWDTYTLDFSNSLYNLAGSNPTSPLALNAGVNQTVQAVVTPKTNTSLLLTVKNNNNELQSSASAQLMNTALNYDVTKITTATGSADFGQVFFGSLTPETYDLKVTLSGYIEATSSVSLSGAQSQTIILNPAL